MRSLFKYIDFIQVYRLCYDRLNGVQGSLLLQIDKMRLTWLLLFDQIYILILYENHEVSSLAAQQNEISEKSCLLFFLNISRTLC